MCLQLYRYPDSFPNRACLTVGVQKVMVRADLYEHTISFERYLSQSDCRACGFFSREEFLNKLKKGAAGYTCSGRIDPQRLLALRIAVRPDLVIPSVEISQLPNPGPTGLFPINDPAEDSPVLVSGNSLLTIEVLSAVLSTTISPFWYLTVDTLGHTVDMALVLNILTPDRIIASLSTTPFRTTHRKRSMVIPGLASHLKEDIAQRTGWSVQVGPICAAELPLYFGAAWHLRVDLGKIEGSYTRAHDFDKGS